MKQGSGKRLNDKQRIEIIQLSENSKITKRQLADDYGVSEAAIRKLLLKKDEFLKRYYDAPEELRDQRLRGKSATRMLGGLSSYKNDYITNLSMDAMNSNGSAPMLGLLSNSGKFDAELSNANSAIVAAAAAAMGSNFTSLSSSSLYPQNEPWMQGYPLLIEKMTPFLREFCQQKFFDPTVAELHAGTSHLKGPNEDVTGPNLMQKTVARVEEGMLETSACTTENDISPGIGVGIDGNGVQVSTSSTTSEVYGDNPSLENRMLDWIGLARMLRDIRYSLHCNPELGYRERKTQSFIRHFCETGLKIPSENIQVLANTGLVIDICCDNAIVESTEKRKLPVLAFRADMDALPIEEMNNHLPYCSHQTKGNQDESRKRKKRRHSSTNNPESSSITMQLDETTCPPSDLANNCDQLKTTLNIESDVESPVSAHEKQSIAGQPLERIKIESTALHTFNPSSMRADSSEVRQEVSGLELDEIPRAASVPAAHMCGHDGHMTILLGLMTLIVRQSHLLPRDSVIRFLFQPAEEGPGGAQRMIEEGVLDIVDEVYGLHNYPFPLYSIHARPGPVMAHEIEFTINIQGIGGHASAPQDCVDPVYVGSTIVQVLQSIVSRSLSPTENVVISVTQFQAGDTNNVIPSIAKLGGTIRNFDLKLADSIKKRVELIAQSSCRALGATCTISFVDGYPPVVNPYQETRLVQQIAHEVGLYVSQEGLPLMAAEDFAYYLQERKGCFFFLGTKEQHDDPVKRALHSNRFDFNDKATPLGIRMFLGIIQARFQCFLYSLDEMQTFQVAMERILGEPNYAIC
ncbi:unnamed protein product [Albugo candida]|uniref:Peptidase M20 dimerisation domain-containing protein n=1 Tax=Albugo candida TaxID=65357 RepID=A0A024GPJ4_9STRA|nr:unnamed protein product [Albugo candida]|eukprot:CCI48660.1 unnamed protein product [Albugo candida]